MRFCLWPNSLNNPHNAGGFKLTYIEPEEAFISTIVVSNNGTLFQIDGSTMQYPEPYGNGFEQFSYVVLDSTNYVGIQFPHRVAFYQFSTLPSAHSQANIYPVAITHLAVEQIDVSEPRLAVATPSVVLALDSRPTGLNNGVTVNYRLTNDDWPSLSNKRLTTIASIVRKQPINQVRVNSKPDYPRNRKVIVGLLICLTLFPVVSFFTAKQQKTTNKENKVI
jgi:hypothetical protein